MKTTKMKPETEALLSILIHEVKKTLPKGNQAVEELLDSWIIANNLPVNEVQTMTKEEFTKWYQELEEQSWFYRFKRRLRKLGEEDD